MRRIVMFVLVSILALGALAGCGGSQTAPGGTDAAGKQKVLVHTIPTQASDKFKEQMKQLGAQLSAETGLDVQIEIPTDYAAVVEALRFGKIDVAYLGPFTYVVANAQSGAQAFVTQSVHGRPYYNSYAIVPKDSPIQQLTDKDLASLKGMDIALGDPASTSSSIFPQLFLKRSGLDLEKDIKKRFTGKHDNVLKTVVAGQAPIGFLDSAIFEGSLKAKFPEDYAKVRVVWKSPDLFQYPWAARKDLDPQIVAKLKAAFLKIKDPNLLEPFGADGFVEADDSKFNDIREAAKELGIDLVNYQVK